MKTAGAFAFGILFALAPLAAAHPQETPPTSETDTPLRQMLRLIEVMEPDSALRLGESLLRQHPDDPALNAAYLIARLDRLEDLYWFYHVDSYDSNGLAWNTSEVFRQLEERAAANASRWSDDPWTQVALAHVLAERTETAQESLAAAARARELAPRDPDVIRYVATLITRRGTGEEALALIDSLAAEGIRTPGLRLARIAAIDRSRAANPELYSGIMPELRALRAEHPDYAPAYHVEAVRHASTPEGPTAERLGLHRRAVELAPRSLTVRIEYWETLQWMGVPDSGGVQPRESQDAVVADVDAFVRTCGGSIDAIHGALYFYWDYGVLGQPVSDEQMFRWAEHLSREFPGTPESVRAELILAEFERSRLDSIPVSEQPAAMRRLRTDLERIAENTPNAVDAERWEAAALLFDLMRRDPSVPADELLALHQRTPSLQLDLERSFYELPLALAQRNGFDQAEALARAAFDAIERDMETQKDRLGVDRYATHYDDARSDAFRILATVLHAAGRQSEAEEQLESALQAAPDNPAALNLLGRIAEARGDVAAAEEAYAKGTRFVNDRRSRTALGRWSPPLDLNTEALGRLYRQRTGSESVDSTAFASYLAAVDSARRERSRQRIHGSRIADPRPLPPFELDWLDGRGTFSNDSLQGKVAIINFWGVWCGPCRKEAPDIQKVYDTYRDHPDVVFLTISNDPDPQTTRVWMEEKGLTYPVLLGARYAERVVAGGWPYTAFIDRNGRIAFEASISETLVEEFTWRIEQLLESRAGRRDGVSNRSTGA